MNCRTATSRLAILGSWPPPAGGVSIHTQRLCALLDQRGTPYVVYNATSDVGDGDKVIGVYRKRRSWLVRYLFTAREDAIYIFSARLSAWLVGALLAVFRGKRVMLRLRNAALIDWMATSRVKRWLSGMALRRMRALVCVNRELARAAVELGVDPQRVHWSPGFLPPGAESTRRDGVAEQVWTFLDGHSPIIAANGKVNRYAGEDLYGLDQLVELAARLKPDFPNIGIVVCFWEHHPDEQAYVDALLRRAEELGARDHILFNTQPGPFVPVLHAADVFVRPTNSDGDANSIREALYLGVPAVASDVVTRPDGTRTFPTRDLDAFVAQVRAALSDDPRPREAPPALTRADEERIAKYLELLTAFAHGNTLPVAQPLPA